MRTVLWMLMYLLLMPLTQAYAQEDGETCAKPLTYEEECTIGRWKQQCSIFDCAGRQIIVVKSKDGRPKIIMFKSPCFGERIVYRRNDIEL